MKGLINWYININTIIKCCTLTCYIRHLTYCFYIAVNRICVAISRVDGALKPWSAIHLEVGNSKQKPAYLDLPVQLCKVCFGSWGGRNHYYDSTAQMVMQQHVVEHGEHDKAQKKSWSSTASGLSSRCPVLPLDPATSGWKSEVDSARLTLTIIQFTAHVILISNTHSQKTHICADRGARRVSLCWWHGKGCSNRRENAKRCGSSIWFMWQLWSHNQQQKDWGSISASTLKALQGAYHHSERSTTASGRQVHLPWKYIV